MLFLLLRIRDKFRMNERKRSLPRGKIILGELPNLLAIAVTSDTWRGERLFKFALLTLFIIHLYNHP
jgi:hypothetical protein